MLPRRLKRVPTSYDSSVQSDTDGWLLFSCSRQEHALGRLIPWLPRGKLKRYCHQDAGL